MTMRFYRGDESHHHDFALVQVVDPDSAGPPEPWSMEPRRVGVNHIAIGYPDRGAWLSQLEHLKANGVEFIVRGNHGMTHSAYIADPDGYGIEVLYDLPEEVWSGDVTPRSTTSSTCRPKRPSRTRPTTRGSGPMSPSPSASPVASSPANRTEPRPWARARVRSSSRV